MLISNPIMNMITITHSMYTHTLDYTHLDPLLLFLHVCVSVLIHIYLHVHVLVSAYVGSLFFECINACPLPTSQGEIAMMQWSYTHSTNI